MKDMSRRGFQFKRFGVMHDQSSMKVGTDAVLLGAWCSVELGASAALDIGAGCGVVALMVAQRGEEWAMEVECVEIDLSSAQQATENAEASPWAERVRVKNCSVQSFTQIFSPENIPSNNKSFNNKLSEGSGKKYDLIVSNPPYFNNALHSPDAIRNAARHTTSLTFEELLDCVALLLSAVGRFAVVLPYVEAERFTRLAGERRLGLCRQTDVRSVPSAVPNRVLLEYGREQQQCVPIHTQLTLREEEGGFSEEYKTLTSAFYLHF